MATPAPRVRTVAAGQPIAGLRLNGGGPPLCPHPPRHCLVPPGASASAGITWGHVRSWFFGITELRGPFSKYGRWQGRTGRHQSVRLAAAVPEAGSHLRRTVDMPTLAYELVTGRWVTWTPNSSRSERPPPTAVLVHGIMGSKRNLQSLARRLVENFPSWQVLLVDLRNHGGSANLPWPSPSTVDASAADVLRLLSQLKLFPRIIIGHSFGGKVVLAMSLQFCKGKTRLPRPVQVWVLDALPGEVRSEDSPDHPQRLIDTLREIPMPLKNRKILLDFLAARGFSEGVAQWVATNLRPTSYNRSLSQWTFDLEGIAEMYDSYEHSSYWEILKDRPLGLDIDFVRAEKSTFRWSGPEQEIIEGYNCGVYTLLEAGHWVHHDNLDGLIDILRDSINMHDATMPLTSKTIDEMMTREYDNYSAAGRMPS